VRLTRRIARALTLVTLCGFAAGCEMPGQADRDNKKIDRVLTTSMFSDVPADARVISRTRDTQHTDPMTDNKQVGYVSIHYRRPVDSKTALGDALKEMSTSRIDLFLFECYDQVIAAHATFDLGDDKYEIAVVASPIDVTTAIKDQRPGERSSISKSTTLRPPLSNASQPPITDCTQEQLADSDITEWLGHPLELTRHPECQGKGNPYC
jgi:hypothetical protein